MPATYEKIAATGGIIYFEANDSSGNLGGGEKELAQTQDLTITVASESLQDYSSDGKVGEKDLEVVYRVTRDGAFACKNMAIDMLALFAEGAVATVTQTATPVVDETYTAVVADRWYQLGRSLSNPTGVRNVSSVVITGPGGTPTRVAGTDYELDATMARFRPITGSAMVGVNALVDYTPAANSRQRIATDNLGPRSGGLRFVGDNLSGANRDIWLPLVTLEPDGSLAFKPADTPTVMQMRFKIKIQTRPGYAQMYIDGRPV